MVDVADASRRQFLFGARAALAGHRVGTNGLTARTLRIEIDLSCLARHNVVCQSCAEACGVSAIRFSPRPGRPALPVISTDLCTACGDCDRVCPVGAINITSFEAEGPDHGS